ncbi:hypothetical protein MARBORIA2_04000 [Methanobrevibacter arboriphilus]|uniref:Uncharacterized protein n=2 Tax=Methanobrevibacter arboriphilus TaxID=39441 RepID=A0ACA8R1F0_METAZ|nr:PIN domain-containing protein [Methanobrevibacter arboriphilus]BBL61356.1 hypothetical protein MarbSA_03960 [Methanobrevibacter arboriphilus]GLI11310.1 hypothetical protein MARBORIA2_04000 [Methanobrevibacter arboriphilus]
MGIGSYIMIFVDSCLIIALVVEKDQWHNQSLLLVEDLEKEEKVITEAMILESLNMIGKCKGGKVGRTIFQYIEDNYRIYKTPDFLNRAMKEFIKYDGILSLADCTAIIAMKDLGICEIYSFDDHFDKVDGILRVN